MRFMKPIAWASCIILVSCSDFWLGSNPRNTPTVTFDQLWSVFDRYYSAFEIRGVNWDSLYTVYRPIIRDDMTELQLFNACEGLLAHLNDGHVYLLSPFKSAVSNAARQNARPLNFDFENIKQTYLKSTIQSDGHFVTGTPATGIGYIWIPTFEDEDFARVDDWVKGLDDVLQTFENRDGMVIDVRNNGGGDASNAQAVAGRFADQKRLFSYGYSRNGPNRNDFSEPFAWYVKPTGKHRFLKTIVLLTNKRTASGAERFVLAMKALPQVIVVGDTTEGALPHALPRELPNGWVCRVTVGVVEGPDHRTYEGVGIPPDETVHISSTDASQAKDTILERAIQLIHNPVRTVQR